MEKYNKNYKDDEQILTYDELQKYIGKYVYFSYEYGTHYYAWIKKITRIEIPQSLLTMTTEEELKKNIRYLKIYGTYSMVMYRKGQKLEKLEPSSKNRVLKEKMSDAQWAARLPTKEEFKLYTNAVRKYKIFGDND